MREKQGAKKKEKEWKTDKNGSKPERKKRRMKHKAAAHTRKDRCGNANLDQRWRPIDQKLQRMFAKTRAATPT